MKTRGFEGLGACWSPKAQGAVDQNILLHGLELSESQNYLSLHGLDLSESRNYRILHGLELSESRTYYILHGFVVPGGGRGCEAPAPYLLTPRPTFSSRLLIYIYI